MGVILAVINANRSWWILKIVNKVFDCVKRFLDFAVDMYPILLWYGRYEVPHEDPIPYSRTVGGNPCRTDSGSFTYEVAMGRIHRVPDEYTTPIPGVDVKEIKAKMKEASRYYNSAFELAVEIGELLHKAKEHLHANDLRFDEWFQHNFSKRRDSESIAFSIRTAHNYVTCYMQSLDNSNDVCYRSITECLAAYHEKHPPRDRFTPAALPAPLKPSLTRTVYTEDQTQAARDHINAVARITRKQKKSEGVAVKHKWVLPQHMVGLIANMERLTGMIERLEYMDPQTYNVLVLTGNKISSAIYAKRC